MSSTRRYGGAALWACALGVWAPGAAAHSFGQRYVLPVPVWLYLYGAAAALAMSFVVIAWFVTAAPAPGARWRLDLSATLVVRAATRLHVPAVVALLGVLSLLLCIVTGFWGTPNPYGNFNMTFFWIVFVLGLTYLSALIGDIYAIANPWRALVRALDRVFTRFSRGRMAYPRWLGYWPALAFYMAFIWLELFGRTGPFSLAVILSAYTAINLAGAWLVGGGNWFKYCELFSVFFRLIAAMAPLAWPDPDTPGERRGPWLRPPFAGVLRMRIEHMSLLVFVLFMLASTAFDGLHNTTPWRAVYWVHLYPAVLADWVGHNPFLVFPKLLRFYLYWQSAWLVLAPFIYLAVYLLFIGLAKLAAWSRDSLRTLSLRFALSLLPIALAYNIAHYYTLIQTQGPKIVNLLSDPLGRRWDLFGTRNWLDHVIIPDPTTVWHVQVGVIVFGHIVGVYIAHLEAIRTFASRRRALASQLPMLLLMVLFTTAGLWILGQPIQGGG